MRMSSDLAIKRALIHKLKFIAGETKNGYQRLWREVLFKSIMDIGLRSDPATNYDIFKPDELFLRGDLNRVIEYAGFDSEYVVDLIVKSGLLKRHEREKAA